MGLSGTVFVQVVIIFLLMCVGFILSKTGTINKSGIRQMTNILLIIVTPCVLINAFQRDVNTQLLWGLAQAGLFAVLTHIAAIVIASLVFRKEESLRYRVSIFSVVYSNCGFMAIPLLAAAIGEDGVFYGSAYLAVFNAMSWTHGVSVYSGGIKDISLKKIFLNPGIIGTAVAILLFVLKIRLPYVVSESVSHLAGLNTPLAMIVMGSYLTEVDFKKVSKNISIYLVALLRLVVVPIAAILLAKLLNINPIAAQPVIIAAACPSAATSALFADKYEMDAVYATETVAFTTILSVITIPLVLMLY